MSNNLNNNQILAAHLVAQGKTGREISKKLSVTEETISRWKKQSSFIAYVNGLLIELRDITQQKIRNIIFQAIDILEEELMKKDSANKLNIALKIMQFYKFNSLVDQEIGPNSQKLIRQKQLDKRLLEFI
jgi:transposase